MNVQQHQHRQPRRQDYGFAFGVLTGAFVGAGLAFLFAPRLAALHERVADSAKDLGTRASDGYARISAQLDKAADDVTRKGQDARDGVADVVAHGAHEVERYAKAIKTR
jgi:gas vesicle protein